MTSKNLNFKHLRDFFDRWLHKLIPEKEQEEDILPPLPRKKSWFLIFLKILPWLSLIVFGISMFYDPLKDYTFSFPWRSESLHLEGILRMLAVTGLVGFGTNYIAIKMLFHPRKKRPILGQGLIPSSKVRIAHRLGESINKEVINPHLIVKRIRETGMIKKYMDKFNLSLKETVQLKEFQRDVMDLIEYYVNSILRSEEFRKNIKNFIQGIDFDNLKGIEAGLIKIYRLIGGEQEVAKRIEEIILSVEYKIEPHESLIRQYLNQLPEFIDKNQDTIENLLLNVVVFLIERINIKKIIIQNLLDFDELRLEKLILYSTSDQLAYIQYLGCLLGILGGLFIWIPVESFVVMAVLGISIFLLDEFLYRKANH